VRRRVLCVKACTCVQTLKSLSPTNMALLSEGLESTCNISRLLVRLLQYREDLAQVTLALATSLLEVRHKQLQQQSATPLADAGTFFAGLGESKSLSIFKERLQDAMNGLTLQVQQDVQQYTKRKSTLHQINVYLQRVQALSKFLELMVLVLGKDSFKPRDEEIRLDILNTMVSAAELLETALYRSKDLNIMRLGEHRDLPYLMVTTTNQILSALYVYLHGPCASQLDRLSSSFFDVMRELLTVVPMTEAFNVTNFAHEEVGDSTLRMLRLLCDLLAMIVNTESAYTQMVNALLLAHETFGAMGTCMEWLLSHLRIFDDDADLTAVLAAWHPGYCTFQQEKEMLRDCLSRKSGKAGMDAKDSDPLADAKLLRTDARRAHTPRARGRTRSACAPHEHARSARARRCGRVRRSARHLYRVPHAY
jgi:hypothetical protein